MEREINGDREQYISKGQEKENGKAINGQYEKVKRWMENGRVSEEGVVERERE